MAEQTIIPPATGNPGVPALAPAPVPAARHAFRATRNTQPIPQNVAITPYPVARGISDLVVATEGYDFVKNDQPEPNTFLPSALGLKGAIYLTTSRLANHDRFLKEGHLWHPIMDEAYLCFAFLYHCLRCQRHIGRLSPDDFNLLSTLEAQYPPTSIHIPGTYVQFFQALTVTENPYPWLGVIGPHLPALGHRTASNVFLGQHQEHVISPVIPALIDAIHGVATSPLVAADGTAVINNLGRKLFIPTNRQVNTIRGDDAQRMYLTSLHYRLPFVQNNRIDRAFQLAVAHNIGNNGTINQFVLDLPTRILHNADHDTPMSILQFLGLQDYHHTPNRDNRLRIWPRQYGPTMAAQCGYIEGSRSLNDLPLVGLGASSPSWTIAPAPFNMDDPAPNGGQDALADTVYTRYFMVSMPGVAHNRDPSLEKVAAQVSTIAQVNSHFENVDLDAELNLAGIKSGPFWNFPVSDIGAQFDLATFMAQHIPNLIRYNRRT
uniref:Putative coat protein n=1 Tax=Rosellinia necatrix partitivirus 9 TaxID=2056550 RepID=A0A2Z5WAF9_9VIRU|nr:putative coat protein [Rosellinia necatrix partitivirus 9]